MLRQLNSPEDIQHDLLVCAPIPILLTHSVVIVTAALRILLSLSRFAEHGRAA